MQKYLAFGVLAIVPILLLTTQTVRADLTPGDQAARDDFKNGNGFQPSCQQHGYDPTADPGFCLKFKTDYIEQWAVLGLAS